MLLSEALRKCSSYQVGNGNHAAFWNDAWLGDEPLRDRFPRLYKISSSIGCMHGSWSWNVFWHRNLRAFERDQFLVWNIEKDGKFLFKTCTPLMNRSEYHGDRLKSKHSVHNRLCTKSFLLGRWILSSEQSDLCK